MTANTFNPTPHGKPQFMTPAGKTWVANLLELIFGDAKPHGAQEAYRDTPLPRPDSEPMPPFNSDSSEAFRSALMDATTKFANRHVRMLNQINPRNVYSVHEVNIEFTGAPDQFIADIADWPNDVCNECVKLIMEEAPGAKELLTLQDYFGTTIVTDIKLVKGKVVQPLVSYSGSRFEIKFAFDGRVIQLPETVPQPAAPAPISTPFAIDPSIAPAPIRSPVPQAWPDDLPVKLLDEEKPGFHFVSSGTQQDYPAWEDTGATVLRNQMKHTHHDSNGTQLRDPETPVAQTTLNLRLRSGDTQVLLPLREDGFPYTIGRHASFKGYSVRSKDESAEQAKQLLLDAEGPGFASFASREHLVLHSFDASTQQFRVSCIQHKNGTFFRAAPLQSHFLLRLPDMKNGEWLKLGGTSGDGILEVRIEAV
jgi:hypothetical protein